MAATAVGRAAGDGLERCVELGCVAWVCLFIVWVGESLVFVAHLVTGALRMSGIFLDYLVRFASYECVFLFAALTSMSKMLDQCVALRFNIRTEAFPDIGTV